MLFREMIVVYSENNTLSGKMQLLTVKAGGTYNKHRALKG
jgi:hypothetical protein